ncbi:hypothetical protein P691DRAFT_728713 [Macrolepiota fuliginosa MF-IS2]|uniref:DnaJ homologue subfamily C member 28 conserved domain-containing protein n=1 Tax=Macrolepiota fuliginosa MF-IS2 TaxID=1400762 RepID=A0A9P5XFQ0_9AGAR|nr:hypothetical protein P691DRAFT_728713 [Macrolepiota fuliginosa MF-IS2]
MHLAKCAPTLQHLQRTLPTLQYTTPHRSTHSHKHSASDKLFADASREELSSEETGTTADYAKSPKLQILEQEHENWTGDENIKDAVLRMLVDKYKPLRGPTIITAEEKLKRASPKVVQASVVWSSSAGVTRTSPGLIKPRSGSWADEPLLPSSETHKPWETTFKAPKHDGALSIRALRIQSSTVSGVSCGSAALGGSGSLDERLVRKEKERMKKMQQVGRLSHALESTLDYRLGIKHGQMSSVARPNPVGMRGWNSLIEDKIEKARSAGLFKNVKGRGQPLARSVDEVNPFIAREEFLMNRIVQRNGASPPWVEVQSELDTAVRSFRELLRQSWIRRAVRTLTTNNPAELLHRITLNEVRALRDPDWVRKEQSYHETAIAELNSLVRKYNGLAPYAVRRSYYYTREGEIERMYESSVEDVMRELEERLRDPGFIGNTRMSGGGGHARAVGCSSGENSTLSDVAPTEQDHPPPSWRIRDLLRDWIKSTFFSRSSRL